MGEARVIMVITRAFSRVSAAACGSSPASRRTRPVLRSRSVSCGRSVAAVVAGVPRAFVARRPFLHGPAARVRFTTAIVVHRPPAHVVPADVIPARGGTARGDAAVLTTVIPPDRAVIAQAVVARVPLLRSATAGILGAARITVGVARICTAEVSAVVHPAVAHPTVVGTARHRAPRGRTLLHHPLLGAGIAAADLAFGALHGRSLRALETLGTLRAARITGHRTRCRLLRASRFLGGTRPLGGAAAPLLGSLDDFGRGSS